jgi:2-octaprenyl-6-methoxyphenol hydroxylase
MEPDSLREFDVVVVGGGPAGLAAALAIAQTGVSTALIARREPYADNRTTALLGGSVAFLDSLGVWKRCEAQSSPLKAMRLVDDTARLIRAPEVRFDSTELGFSQFGFNIANRDLMRALEDTAAASSSLVRIDSDADSIVTGDDRASLHLRNGESLTAALVVGADGRNSLCREAAGIAVSRSALPQSALTFNVAHSRPHDGISTEFHTAQGPCVFVPLPGHRSSVVWVSSSSEAQRLKSLDDAALARAVEAQSHHILGKLTVSGERHLFPLAIERPASVARNRVALVGEAAHVLPPIGAQGLNMGLRDSADLARVVGSAWSAMEDFGAPQTLTRYVRLRTADVVSRTFAIDLANRSLLSDFLPIQAARAAGLHALAAIGPLRRLAMREGLAPSWRSHPS